MAYLPLQVSRGEWNQVLGVGVVTLLYKPELRGRGGGEKQDPFFSCPLGFNLAGVWQDMDSKSLIYSRQLQNLLEELEAAGRCGCGGF